MQFPDQRLKFSRVKEQPFLPFAGWGWTTGTWGSFRSKNGLEQKELSAFWNNPAPNQWSCPHLKMVRYEVVSMMTHACQSFAVAKNVCNIRTHGASSFLGSTTFRSLSLGSVCPIATPNPTRTVSSDPNLQGGLGHPAPREQFWEAGWHRSLYNSQCSNVEKPLRLMPRHLNLLSSWASDRNVLNPSYLHGEDDGVQDALGSSIVVSISKFLICDPGIIRSF